MKTKKGWDGLSNRETKNPKKEERRWLKLKNRVGWKDVKGVEREKRGGERRKREKESESRKRGEEEWSRGCLDHRALFVVCVNKIKIIFIAGHLFYWRRNLFTLARPHTTFAGSTKYDVVIYGSF
jgi:hypothetical protein